jgi:hypothetical protein
MYKEKRIKFYDVDKTSCLKNNQVADNVQRN